MNTEPFADSLPGDMAFLRLPVPGDAVFTRRSLLVAAGAFATNGTRADTVKPLRLIVPFPPGGSSDILARAIGAWLGTTLGRGVLIDNRAGAGGSLGAAEAARAPADGDTLLMAHLGVLAVNPALYPRLPYDPIKSFVPVAWVARVPNLLVVHAAAPVRSLAALIARARSTPMSYSSGGNGSAANIAMELLKLKARFPMLHVPYKGTSPSVTDLLGGQVDATFTGAPAVLPQIRAGRLRALVVSSPARLPSLPDVPTVAESGFPGFDADQWYGLVAPARTPPPVVDRLNAEVGKALHDPEVLRRMASEGAVATPGTPQAFGALIAREIPRWAEVVKAANLKADS